MMKCSPEKGAPQTSVSPGLKQPGPRKLLLDRKYFTRRWVLAYLMFIARICQTGLRQCIGMALVCMTHINATDLNYNYSYNSSAVRYLPDNAAHFNRSLPVDLLADEHWKDSERPVMKEFQWSSIMEGQVLASYYYGFLLTVLAGGYVDSALGSVRTVGLGLGVGSLVNLLTPELTRISPYLLVALRGLAGGANGLIDAPIQSLLSRWAPVSERGQLAAVEYSGIALAGVLTFLISAFLCQIPVDNGWPFVFYFYGSTSFLFTLMWLYLASDSPELHPSITDSELAYIFNSRTQLRNDDKVRPPWIKILTSGPVWAIMVAHISFFWVYSWILAYLPMFMEEVLHYTISQNGVLSSLPFLAKLVSGLGAGYLADWMLRHNFPIVTVRKGLQMIGSVGCAVPMLVISFLSKEGREVAVVMLILSVGLQNFASVAFRINSLDIAPRYAGFLMGFTSTVAGSLTLTAPTITSALLTTKSRDEWHLLLYIVSAVSVGGGLVFLFFAQGEVQSWAGGQKKKDFCLQVEPAPPGEAASNGEIVHIDDVPSARLLTERGPGGEGEQKDEKGSTALS